MFCTKCGATVDAATAFCGRCGAPVGSEAIGATGAPQTALTRPGLVTFLAVLQFGGAAVWVVMGLAILGGVGLIGSEAGGGARGAMGVVAFVPMALGVLQLLCGIGLWGLKAYGRTLQIVFACIGLIAIPFGTVIAILVLIYLMKPGVKVLFAGKSPADITSEERAQVAAAQAWQTPVIVAIGVLIAACVLVVPILAAIAVPGLLRAKLSGNEVNAEANLRSLQMAEAMYAVSHTGPYTSLDCLVTPSQCPASASDQPLLPSSFAMSTRSGYRFEFHAGEVSAASSAGDAKASKDLTSFAYVAVPETPGVTGSRSFCTDAAGGLCEMAAGPVVITGGKCPAPDVCRPVR